MWACTDLASDHPWLPLQLLIFGLQTTLTTFTALVEMLSWPDYSLDEQLRLCSLYVPYLALGESPQVARSVADHETGSVISVDSFFRLTRIIDHKTKAN